MVKSFICFMKDFSKCTSPPILPAAEPPMCHPIYFCLTSPFKYSHWRFSQSFFHDLFSWFPVSCPSIIFRGKRPFLVLGENVLAELSSLTRRQWRENDVMQQSGEEISAFKKLYTCPFDETQVLLCQFRPLSVHPAFLWTDRTFKDIISKPLVPCWKNRRIIPM